MNVSAQSDKNKSTNPPAQVTISTSGGSSSKEREGVGSLRINDITSTHTEVELPKEVESIGVTAQKTEVVIPPDISKLGVTGTSQTVKSKTDKDLPKVNLPLTDDQVGNGLHKPIIDAFRWLAVWCLRRLKGAHLTLKKVHGHFVRIKVK